MSLYLTNVIYTGGEFINEHKYYIMHKHLTQTTSLVCFEFILAFCAFIHLQLQKTVSQKNRQIN